MLIGTVTVLEPLANFVRGHESTMYFTRICIATWPVTQVMAAVISNKSLMEQANRDDSYEMFCNETSFRPSYAAPVCLKFGSAPRQGPTLAWGGCPVLGFAVSDQPGHLFKESLMSLSQHSHVPSL